LAFAQKRNIAKSDPVLSSKHEYKSSNYKDSDSLSVMSSEDAQTMSSSVKSDNLREVWKILSENEDNSLLKSEKNFNDFFDESYSQPGLLDDAIKVTSYKSVNEIPTKMSSKSPSLTRKKDSNKNNLSAKTTPKSAPASSSRVDLIKNQKPKIRNYNIKE
jgi:hypothetical protein